MKIRTIKALDALPVGAIVATGDGFQYTRLADGNWSAPFAVSTPSAWLFDPEHSRQPLTPLKPCMSCDRLMRPQHTLVSRFPGTVLTGVGGQCITCTEHHAIPKSKVISMLCARCGCPNGRPVLCGDCRDTLSPAERKEWA